MIVDRVQNFCYDYNSNIFVGVESILEG